MNYIDKDNEPTEEVFPVLEMVDDTSRYEPIITTLASHYNEEDPISLDNRLIVKDVMEDVNVKDKIIDISEATNGIYVVDQNRNNDDNLMVEPDKKTRNELGTAQNIIVRMGTRTDIDYNASVNRKAEKVII